MIRTLFSAVRHVGSPKGEALGLPQEKRYPNSAAPWMSRVISSHTCAVNDIKKQGGGK